MIQYDQKVLALGNFFSQEQLLKNEFTFLDRTVEDVYRLAAGISSVVSDEIVCLAEEDKAVVAASVLASMVSRITLVLPYSYSKAALEEIQKETGFTKMISTFAKDLPSGVSILTPKPAESLSSFMNSLKKANQPDRAFINLFTGGSTGKSKVWTKTFRNLFGESFYLAEKFKIGKHDRILSTVPPYHIYGLLFSVLLPLVSSASVLPDVYVFPQEILTAIQKAHPTVLVSIPIHYKSLNQTCMASPLSIVRAFSSAAPLSKSDSIAFYERTGIGITEIFGSTETGGIAVRCQASGQESFKPFDCIDWKKKDDRLCIRSDFISPLIETDEQGFFTTGDRISSSTDSDSFMVLGRADDIIKVAGKRVDLREVQQKLLQIKGVANAVVSAAPADAGRDNDIVALIEGNVDESEIRRLASEKLESYAVPRRFIFEDKIPVSAIGKYTAGA